MSRTNSPTCPGVGSRLAGHRDTSLTLRSTVEEGCVALVDWVPSSTVHTSERHRAAERQGVCFRRPVTRACPFPLPTRAALPWRMAWDGMANWSPPSCAQGDVSAFASDSTFATQCAGRALLHATVHARVSIKSVVVLCCVLYLLQRAVGDRIRSIDKACYKYRCRRMGGDESLPSHEAGSPNCQHNTSWLDATSCSLPSPLLVGLRMIPVAEPIKGH